MAQTIQMTQYTKYDNVIDAISDNTIAVDMVIRMHELLGIMYSSVSI